MIRPLLVLAVLATSCSQAVNPIPSPRPPAMALTVSLSPVVLIVMENHEYGQIVGNLSAPYLNNTFIPNGRLFTHYYAVSHPSLPNYLAMTSGGTSGKDGTNAISIGEIAGGDLFRQLSGKYVSWASYDEDIPSACYKGQDVLKHDPAMTYANIANSSTRCLKVQPLSALNPAALAQFSFITPNLCNDMHDCSIATGDAWLGAHVPPLLAAGATVIITFDEGTTNDSGGGHVLLTEDGPGISRSGNGSAYNHYGLLAGLEKRYGLNLLRGAQTAVPVPL